MSLWQTIKSWFNEPSEATPAPKKTRKKPDTTKLTQYHYDFIVSARQEWEEYNRTHPGKRKSLQELVDAINERMGTNKSGRALGRIWSGEVPRDSLATGQPCFEY